MTLVLINPPSLSKMSLLIILSKFDFFYTPPLFSHCHFLCSFFFKSSLIQISKLHLFVSNLHLCFLTKNVSNLHLFGSNLHLFVSILHLFLSNLHLLCQICTFFCHATETISETSSRHLMIKKNLHL